MVRPERLELPAYWFEASRSIQLSYGRTLRLLYKLSCRGDGSRHGNVCCLYLTTAYSRGIAD